MDGRSLEWPIETFNERTDGMSIVAVLMACLLVGWLDKIGGVNEGAIVVTSSSWYRMVVPSSDEERSGSASSGIAACQALRRCPSDVWKLIGACWGSVDGRYYSIVC